jgi:hypothetical protein
MADAVEWEKVFESAVPKQQTFCAVVPGGWIYRHLTVPFERPKPSTSGVMVIERELIPSACESMVFVPTPKK